MAGSNNQRDFISKEDDRPPTVSTESVLLTCIVDAKEHIYVVTLDMPNAFIQTRIEYENDMTFINIWVVLVDIILNIAPDICGPYVITVRKGIKQLIF